MREITPLSPTFDTPPARRLALVSLASDPVSSDEIRAVCRGPDCAVHETRIANSDTISAETLTAMEAGLTESAARLPVALPYDAAAYLCTSASRLIGFDRVASLITDSLPGAAVTNPMLAAIRACDAVGAKRIALITPYVAEITDALAAGFEESGIVVARTASFFTDSDAAVARISAEAIGEAASRMAGDADAVFVSCTALRTVHMTAGVEAALGRPMLSSNQAVAWDLLRLSGGRPAPGDWGRLFAG